MKDLVLANIDPYVGKYYSVEYVRKKILRQTEEEVSEIDDQIKKEMDAGIIIDPNFFPPTGQLVKMPQDQNWVMSHKTKLL